MVEDLILALDTFEKNMESLEKQREELDNGLYELLNSYLENKIFRKSANKKILNLIESSVEDLPEDSKYISILKEQILKSKK